MEGELYVNTGRLRDHKAVVEAERQTAQHLYDSLRVAYQHADPADAGMYIAALQKADKLVRYFTGMENAIDMLADDFEALSRSIRHLLELNLH